MLAWLGLPLFAVLCVKEVQGYGRGAPACVSAPKHKVAPQTSPPPYQITLVKKEVEGEPTGSWILTVGSDEESAPDYKGILIVAQQSGELESVDNKGKFKAVRRGCKGKTAFTHSKKWSGDSNTNKSKSVWEFSPAEGSTLDPSFNIHIVQEYSMYWANIEVTPTE